jgi:hypothetical protein
MPATLRTKAVAWLRDHRDEFIDLVCLLAALLLSEHLFVGFELPWRAVLCALLVADAVPVCSALAGRRAGRTFLKCLPSYALAAAATAILWHFAFLLPLSDLEYVPVWVALTWLHRVGEPTLSPGLRAWNSRHPAVRLETVPLEIAVLGTLFHLAGSFVPGFWPHRFLPVLACLAWPAVRLLTFRLRPPGAPPLEWLRLGLGFLVFALALAGVLSVSGARFSRPDAVLLAWCAIALAGARAAAIAAVRRSQDPRMEISRWILMGIAGLWLMQGFATFTLTGAGDSLWYSMMLADMVTQVRAGVFPVWMGQSITQFNGAIYPLRIAPGFHYLGALFDLLTLRALGVIALQNLMLTMVGIGTLFSAYFGLVVLVPGRRWLAAGMATLFFACPGVLGMAYKSDLFMSWMTLPWVAVAWFATLRSFRRDSYPTMLLLGASLGLCWWGHSPIALWMTLIAGAAQAIRLAVRGRSPAAWLGALAGAGLFAAIAAYPIGSVLLYPPEPGLKVDAFQRASGETIAFFVHQVFPQVLLPLNPGGHELSSLQLGYSLWAVLTFCVWNLRRTHPLGAGIALGTALFLALLLIPIPGLNLAVWNAIPDFVRNPTSNWAMNRLYLPLAGAIVFGAAAMVSDGVLDSRGMRRTFAAIIAAGCAWSVAEAAKFLPGSHGNGLRPESAVDMLRPENVMLTRFAYFIFPGPPDVFTHGVTDPAMENRLRSADTLALTATNYGAARASAHTVGSGVFGPFRGGPANFLQLDKTLRIEPRRSYLLEFSFPQGGDTRGVIEIFGNTFHREYAVPEYGGSRAFGAGGDHNPIVPLSTTSAAAVELTLRFFPDKPLPPDGKDGNPAIGAVLLAYDPSTLPVRLDSLIPYRAHVRSPAAGWLEIPRMHQLGYMATVNGRHAALRRSPDGLAWIEVPAGDSRVELDFIAPTGLQALFWLSLASIAAAAAAAARGVWRLL